MEGTKRKYKEMRELIEVGMAVRRASDACGISTATYYNYKKEEERTMGLFNKVKQFLRKK